VKSRVLRLKKHANFENIRLARLRSQYFVTLSAILFRYAPDDSRANNSIHTAPPTFTSVAAPNSGHAKSPLQVCDDLLRQIARNSVFAAGAPSRPKSRLPILLWTKNEPRRGSTPARAAQGMATTSCCGKFLPDRGKKISCRFSLMAAPHSRLKPPCGAGE